MANDRHRLYLSSGTSPRFTQHQYDAQRGDMTTAQKLGMVGLGVAALGGLYRTGALRAPISRALATAGRFRGIYTRAISEGLREWASRPADLNQGISLMLRGRLREGSERLGRSATSLVDHIAIARRRLAMESQSSLHGMMSEFEEKLLGLIQNRAMVNEYAAGYARRNALVALLEQRARRDNNPIYREMAEAISKVKDYTTLNRLTYTRWQNILQQGMAGSYDDNLADEFYKEVINTRIMRRVSKGRSALPFEIGDDIAPQFLRRRDPSAGVFVDEYGLVRNKQAPPHIQALADASLFYHKTKRRFNSLFEEQFLKELSIDPKAQDLMMKRMGVRRATVQDLLDNNMLTEMVINHPSGIQKAVDTTEIMNSMRKVLGDLSRIAAGKGLYVNAAGELIDTRSLRIGVSGALDFLAYETHIPIVKFNPLQLLHYSSVRHTKQMASDAFLGRMDSPQPVITGISDSTLAKLQSDIVLIGDKIYNFETGNMVTNALGQPFIGYQTSTKFGTLANMMATMMSKGTPRPTRPLGPLGTLYDAANFLDVGFQEAPSWFTKVKSIVGKFDDPRWLGNAYNTLLSGADSPGEYLFAYKKVADALSYTTGPISNDAWEAIVKKFAGSVDKEVYDSVLGGINLATSDPDEIMSSLAKLVTSRTGGPLDVDVGSTLSPMYRSRITSMWRQYATTPDAFLRNIYLWGNSAPSQFLEQRAYQTQIDIVKKTIQKELLWDMSRYADMDPLNILEETFTARNLSSKEFREGKYTILSFIMDTIGASHEVQSAEGMAERLSDAIKLVIDQKPTIQSTLDDFVKSRAPIWQYGPLKEPERAIYFGGTRSGVFVGKARPLPYKEAWEWIRDINNEQKYRAFIEQTQAFGRQFTAGRHRPEDVTTLTFFPYFFFSRLNSAVGNFGLALSNRHLGSAWDVAKGLMSKRYLPLYAGLAWGGGGILGYLNWEFGNLFGMRPTQMVASGMKGIHQGLASFRDTFGITSLAKDISRVTPGSEMIWEYPYAWMVDPTQSREEVDEYYETGVDPVRKGRYWSLGNCVTPDTPILVNQYHYKRADEIEIGDIVLTHTGNLKPVKRVITRDMRPDEWAPAVYIHTFPLPTITTDNHPYLVVKHQVANCKPDRDLTICGLYPSRCNNKNVWEPMWTMARDIKAGDYIAFPRPVITDTIDNIFGYKVSNSLGYFLGLYFALGNIHTHNNGKACSIELSFNSSETSLIDFVQEFAKAEFGANSSLRSKGNCTKVTICSRQLAQLIEDSFHVHDSKDVPAYIMHCGKEFLLAFISGYFDGHIQRHNDKKLIVIAITSTRLNHLLFVRSALFALGLSNTISMHNITIDGVPYTGYRLSVIGQSAIQLASLLRSEKTNDIPEPTKDTDKYTYIDDEYVYIKVDSVVDSGYHGVVYDYEVDEDHSFCSLSVILHNTPYVGGKISYYAPNYYQRAMSDVMNTDVMYGSPEEHYRNTPFPTLRNPLAPLNYYILDPYRLEKKHYYDRPYPVTGGFSEFEDMPIVGSFLNATAGQIFKPTRMMHNEYTSARESVRSVNEAQKVKAEEQKFYGRITSSGQMEVVTWMPEEGIVSEPSFGQIQSSVTKSPGSPVIQVFGTGIPYLPSEARDMVRAANVAQKIKAATPKRGRQASPGILESLRLGSPPVKDLMPKEDILSYEDPRYVFGKTYYGLTEMGGIYGFALTAIAGEPYAQAPVIQHANRMTSAERSFWDLELGGLGGDISEIGRRFIPHRQRQQREINNIPNTMPDWMPGEEYFINFRVGDPYIKVPRGEMRLPGEGYESMNLVPGVTLRASASALGGNVEELVEHLTQKKEPIDDYGEYVTEIGNKFHRQYQNMWLRRGLTNKDHIEKEVLDTEHNIRGFVDAIIATPEGPEVIDIKSMSQKRFEESLAAGMPYSKHVEQVNFYMYATGVHRGGLVYVSRDDPSREIYFQFDYNREMLEKALDRLEQARNIAQKMIDSGRVNRFDLYDDFNRFKILADVAPYSEQYKYYASKMTKDAFLTAEQYREVQQIKKRVSKAKKQHRFFPYQFSTADITKINVTIDKVLDNNRFITKQYGDQVFSLAGVYVPSGKNDPAAAEAREFLSRTIAPGKTITIGIDKDEIYRAKKDTLKSIGAVVYDSRGRKVNMMLIDQGLAKEKEDITPAGVHARFTREEIAAGALWEKFAHLDTPLHCIAPWTEIITPQGLVRADQLKPGDLVLTHRGNFKPVVDVRPQREGKRIVDIELSSSNIPITVTDDHPMLACRYVQTSHGTGDKNPKIEFVHAGDLRAYDYLVYKPRTMNESEPPVIDLLSLNPDKFVELDGRVYTKYGGGSPAVGKPSMPRFLEVTKDLARLFGYYAAEGCISVNRDSTAYTILTFSREETTYINDVCRIVRDMFSTEPYIVAVNDTVYVRIGSKFLAELVSRYVGHKQNKVAPEELLTNNALRSEFIRGLFRRDATKAGYAKYGTIGMAAVSVLLWARDALFNLWKIPSAMAIGIRRKNTLYVLRIDKFDQLAEFIDGEQEYVPSEQDIQTRSRCAVGEYIFYRIECVEESEYQDYTIDIEVEDDDTFSLFNATVHNTKFLQVRSPLEDFIRREVYGKNWQSWTHPIRDYVKPTLESIIARQPLLSALSGGALAFMFLRKGTSRAIGVGLVGAATFVASLATKAQEYMTGERWIPARRVKEREIEEYFDILEYLKYKGLYEYSLRRGEEYDRKNPLEKFQRIGEFGRYRKSRMRELEEEKRTLSIEDREANEERISAINRELNNLKNYKSLTPLNIWEIQAHEYKRRMERTLYGADPYGDYDDFIAALPKKYREYAQAFLDRSSPKEREEILKLVPENQRPFFQARWGMEPDEKPDLHEYFKDRFLPPADWEGWLPEKSLDDVKIKVIRREKMDPSEFDIWPEDIRRAEAVEAPALPIFDANMYSNQIRKTLENVMRGNNLENIQIYVMPTNTPGIDVDIELDRDRRQELKEYAYNNLIF
jgi:intein/homing endonuclease/endonuclease YncB( thermonuclease family)